MRPQIIIVREKSRLSRSPGFIRGMPQHLCCIALLLYSYTGKLARCCSTSLWSCALYTIKYIVVYLYKHARARARPFLSTRINRPHTCISYTWINVSLQFMLREAHRDNLIYTQSRRKHHTIKRRHSSVAAIFIYIYIYTSRHCFLHNKTRTLFSSPPSSFGRRHHAYNTTTAVYIID